MDSPQINPPDEIAQALASLPLFLSVKRAAEFLGFCASTIREMVKRGELTALRPEGRNMRIPRYAITQYLEDNTWHAQEKAPGSSVSTEKTTGMSEMDAAHNLRQELRIGRALNAR